MGYQELNLGWALKLTAHRGTYAARRVSLHLLDTVLPVSDKTIRQRKALIRYNHSARFRDPIHGLYRKTDPIPSIRTLQLLRNMDRAERSIQAFMEEDIPQTVQSGIDTLHRLEHRSHILLQWNVRHARRGVQHFFSGLRAGQPT